MDEKHLILEQYRIYNEMKESFINRSFMINRFFMIFSAVFLFSLIFAKMIMPSQFFLLLGLEIFGIASCIMWISNQDAYSTIIKIKYNAVIEKLEEAKSLDFSKSIRLYSQTTKSLDEFQKIVEYIKEHISSDVTFEYYDTICRQVANRIPNIRKFAASHDLVFFVSGKKSSNGKILFNECKKVNPNSHLIDSAEEIDNRLLIGTESIGICGATSTPKWLMEEISKAIKSRI